MSAAAEWETFSISCDIEGETYEVEASAKPTHCPGCGRLLEGER